MRRVLLFLLVGLLVFVGTPAWSQCPEEPLDGGECDTVHFETFGSPETTETFPAFARLKILVTHDLSIAADSIAGFIVPLTIASHSNPSAYCSLSLYWNNPGIIYLAPDVDRSVFRHLPSMADPQIRNRMMDLNTNFMNGWDFIVLDLGDQVSQFFLSMVPTGSMDQRWWEGNRVLLATATFLVQDSMTICVDSTFWAPASRLSFTNYQGLVYFMRTDYLPLCFGVGTGGNDVWEVPGSEESRPSEFSLSQNYPNPFNPVTNVRFTVSKSAQVKIEIFNIVGQRVATLVDQEMSPGTYVADWDSRDENGSEVSSGIYFYRMRAGDFSDMKKMLLVK